MEIDIISKKENKALDRTEVKFDCIYAGEATPKILAVKNKLVALLNTKKDLIVVDSLQPRYGETKADGYAKIYGSKESLADIETEHVLDKNKEVEAKAAEEEVEEPEAEVTETEVTEEEVGEPEAEVTETEVAEEETEEEVEESEEEAEEKTEEEAEEEVKESEDDVNDSKEETAEDSEESEESE